MAVDGTYNVEIDTPMGKQESKLVLKTDGDAVSGNMASPMGTMEFSGGKVSGDAASWDMEIDSPMGKMTLEYNVKVSGDDISGEVKAGNFGSSPLKGKRA
ncbi:MAG: hypothetical protein JXA51_03030 [Dehalococcoidales bacterium]|nr:hypothetical protein [Dehalococcoidales bacterium]